MSPTLTSEGIEAFKNARELYVEGFDLPANLSSGCLASIRSQSPDTVPAIACLVASKATLKMEKPV